MRTHIEDIYVYELDKFGDTFVAVNQYDGWLVIYRNGKEVGMRLLPPVEILSVVS